jgi:hypothetical protein
MYFQFSYVFKKYFLIENILNLYFLVFYNDFDVLIEIIIKNLF